MIAVTAVRTTGIYCRNDCTARPLERNRATFRSAVAAEAAGFRPCLRCRPDRLPQINASAATGVVARALDLIAQGVLDSANEDALAGRLGVTARHLRRLFHEEVGATPDFVARARRAHFGRRLLDETDLPVTDIAFAAGFASVRQMNRVTYDIFRFTPSELRRKRRDADRLVADGGLKLRLPYADDLRFADALAHRHPRAIPGVESVDAAVYRRTISSCGHPGVVEISDARDGKHLQLVVHLPSLQSLIDDVARCRRIFGLDRPPASQTPLARDQLLRPLVRKRRGLRVPGAWDPYETSLRILLGQQVSVAGASTLAGRLVAAFGAPVAGLTPMSLTHVFPPAAAIAGSSIDRLKSIALPTARASAIREFARAYADDRLQLDGAAPLEELLESLRSLPGVGPWTAHMVAMQAAGHGDAFPAGDLGLRRAAATLLGESRPLSESALESLAERWRPHRSLAAMHLWMS